MSKLTEQVKQEIIRLKGESYSSRKIAKELGIGKSTVNDFLAKDTHKSWWDDFFGIVVDEPEKNENFKFKNISRVDPIKIETVKVSREGCTHLMIPDTQVSPEVDMDYLSWIGQYIADKQPDVIVHIGDHYDLPSLSSYDKSTRKAEGRRLNEDINAGITGMNLLLSPIKELQEQQRALYGEVRYKPKMVFTLGNHEERLMRHINANPELEGLVNYSNFKLAEMGWEVYDYLEPATINGVTYIHYFPNPMTGKPLGGSAINRLNKVGSSVTMGHQQTLDMATRINPITGNQEWWAVCGACYPHDEGYKGYTGNKHFRGLIVKHRVSNGGYDPMVVALDYLEEKYGKH